MLVKKLPITCAKESQMLAKPSKEPMVLTQLNSSSTETELVRVKLKVSAAQRSLRSSRV